MTTYISPLAGRYASKEMKHLFSPHKKHSTWRKLWVTLAEAQHELGLPVSQEQVDELQKHTDDIDFDKAAEYEQQLQHDVMAHILTYGDQCPKARPIIHMGATSCYVTDNTELLQMREGMKLLLSKIKLVIEQLSDFAQKYADLPCLGFTHFQPAQLTTVGKRATLWLHELNMDLEELHYRLNQLQFRGIKGTTGTQASYLALFNGDHAKVQLLDHLVAEKMGFSQTTPVTGQTYSRKQDMFILNALSGLAVSAHKFATDLRLLAHMKEVEEPFESSQVGSSAMPYKRNPILSERVCALGRFVISLSENPAYTAATQWLERTLDDSANRRLCIPEAFLTCDGILSLLQRISSGLVVHPKVIARHIQEELPFMATENILMASVKKGGDRHDLHERIRIHSHAAGARIKDEGLDNDLLDRIANDSAFGMTREELDQFLDVHAFVGRAPQQVEEFLQSLSMKKEKV